MSFFSFLKPRPKPPVEQVLAGLAATYREYQALLAASRIKNIQMSPTRRSDFHLYHDEDWRGLELRLDRYEYRFEENDFGAADIQYRQGQGDWLPLAGAARVA